MTLAGSDLVDPVGGTLSREIFSSEELFARELERVFAPAWSFVGHTSQLPRRTATTSSRASAPSRSSSRATQHGAIHVLLNSCRHRGMPVCRYDAGNAASFICSYHGWSYGLDGALIGVPQFNERYARPARPRRRGA